MRDQYAGDISDLLKFAFLRTLTETDISLGVAWYYSAGDDGGPDGRHLEWRDDPSWKSLDPDLHASLSELPERSVAALEKLPIWPSGVIFHREQTPLKIGRDNWIAQKCRALETADLVFLDPDNGLGNDLKKHATYSEVKRLCRPNRSIAFITFPGRSMTHEARVQQLHRQLRDETGAKKIMTLRTNVSVPARRPRYFVQRQRWFTLVDPSTQIIERANKFAEIFKTIPRTKLHINFD